MIERPEILTETADELENYYKKAYPPLAPLVKPCFLNTIDTTVKKLGEEEYFVITGDIEAMWLRDSSFQVMHYVPFAAKDEKLRAILRGIIGKQASQILTDCADIFTEEFERMMAVLLTVVKTEQDHDNSSYTFERSDCPETDTLPCGGLGNPVGRTGMSWSGFRPSDDCCTYGYLIPSNMMAVVALGYGEEILRKVL